MRGSTEQWELAEEDHRIPTGAQGPGWLVYPVWLAPEFGRWRRSLTGALSEMPMHGELWRGPTGRRLARDRVWMTTPSDRIDLKRVLVVHESCDRGCLILVVACGPEMPHQVFKRGVSSAEVPVTARLVGIHPNAAGEQANRELNQGAAVGISPETHQCGNRQPLAAFMPVPLADLGIELGERQFPSSRQIPIVLQPGERCLRLGPLIGLECFDAGAESIRCERAAQRGERRPRVVADKDVVSESVAATNATSSASPLHPRLKIAAARIRP